MLASLPSEGCIIIGLIIVYLQFTTRNSSSAKDDLPPAAPAVASMYNIGMHINAYNVGKRRITFIGSAIDLAIGW